MTSWLNFAASAQARVSRPKLAFAVPCLRRIFCHPLFTSIFTLIKASRGRWMGDFRELAQRREKEGSEGAELCERLAVAVPGEAKNPCPVSGSGPSILRGLFHPNAGTVVDPCCGMVSATLNLS